MGSCYNPALNQYLTKIPDLLPEESLTLYFTEKYILNNMRIKFLRTTTILNKLKK